MKKLLFLLCLGSTAFGQVNPKMFGAIGDGKADDFKACQAAIDSVIAIKGILYLPDNYYLSKPLVASKWNGVEYIQVYFQIHGNASMWDIGGVSMLRAGFKDAPILSIQKGKGVIIEGLNFQGQYKSPGLAYGKSFDSYGDPTCRDSRYSPYAAIAIDPFSGQVPPDGGYPTLRKWYRGSQTRSGSTGIRIQDCTFGNVTIGLITSPNGFTQNAEIITLQNIRIGDCKAGIAGCQAQEKMNRIINIGAWANCHTLFVFNKYGAQQPGNWIIDGVNIAGSVANIIYRMSSGWGPMYITNVFAENIESIGYWSTNSGDVLSNAFINFKYKEQLGFIPEWQLQGKGLTIEKSNIRFYGELKQPVLLNGIKESGNNSFYVPPIKEMYGTRPEGNYRILQPFKPSKDSIKSNTVTVLYRHPYTKDSVQIGDYILFMQLEDWSYLGQGQITAKDNDKVTIGFVSPSIKTLGSYRLGVRR